MKIRVKFNVLIVALLFVAIAGLILYLICNVQAGLPLAIVGLIYLRIAYNRKKGIAQKPLFSYSRNLGWKEFFVIAALFCLLHVVTNSDGIKERGLPATLLNGMVLGVLSSALITGVFRLLSRLSGRR